MKSSECEISPVCMPQLVRTIYFMAKQQMISRTKHGKNFSYYQNGSKVTDNETLERIQKLAVPPAWRDVSIAASDRAKILAKGFDANGRQQAIYNQTFRKKQEQLKFDRTLRFATALPSLRKQVEKDLARKRLHKDTVLACIVKLIDTAYFRVGNEQYAAQNNSYGITTMRSKHVTVSGSTVTFDFMGKSGQHHHKEITDKQLAKIVKRLDEMPGYEIFRYTDSADKPHNISSSDVNDYIKRHSGSEFTAKDFRTWAGTLLATTELLATEYHDNKKSRQKMVTGIVKNVAKQLGNTPSIARSSYIDPRVIAAYVDSDDISRVKSAMQRMKPRKYMTTDEQCVLRLLS